MSFSRIKILQWEIDVDRQKTQKVYQLLSENNCSCQDCLNFCQAVDMIDQENLQIFKSLGIEIKKSHEVYSLYAQDDKTIIYGGFCFITGNIIQGKECYNLSQIDNGTLKQFQLEKYNDLIDIGFRQNLSLIPESLESPVLQVEFMIKLPSVGPGLSSN